MTLPKRVQEYLITGKLSSGHGRALIGVEDPEKIAEFIISRRLNVRQAEALSKQKPEENQATPHAPALNPEKDLLQNQLSALVGWPIEVVLKGESGKISFLFKNPTELDQLMNKFNKLKANSDSGSQRAWVL